GAGRALQRWGPPGGGPRPQHSAGSPVPPGSLGRVERRCAPAGAHLRSTHRSRRSAPVDVHHVHAHGAVSGQSAHHGAQRPGGAPGAADHPAEVAGVDPDLEQVATTQCLGPDLHVVRVVDDAADPVLQRVAEHHSAFSLASASSVASAAASVSAASVSPAASSSAFASAAASASAADLASAALALRSSASASAALIASAAASSADSLRL